MKYEFSLIIPAYNEEKKIEKDIREAISYFKKMKINAELIVSTDGVRDKTNKIVKDLQKEFKNLKLLAAKKRIGKGSAIKKGVNIAQGKIIMFADAGLCVPYKFIKEGIEILGKGYDIALASRGSKKSTITSPQPFYRRIGSKIFGILVRNALGIPKNIQDTQCGFKLYKNDVAKDLFRKLKTKGFMFDIEIILRAKKNNYTLAQFPVQWSNDADTKFDPVSGSIKNFKDLYKIKFNYKL
jgi:glycosyltransferase involved in cell wall biosynthesis